MSALAVGDGRKVDRDRAQISILIEMRSEMPDLRQGRERLSGQLLPAIDHLLITGMKLGPAGKREAINKVLQLLPAWRRGDCWRRIRQLRRRQCDAGKAHPVSAGRQSSVSAAPSPPSSSRRRWTAREDQQLFNWAGYESVDRIAERLRRSPRAIRFRLGALGMSARVRDGWSQRGLMKLLRISPARLRHMLASGRLRARDPRVTHASLAAFHTSADRSRDPSLPDTADDAYSWDTAAHLLGVSLAHLQNLISMGKLKMADTFVTERSFEEFCRRHGTEINMSLLDPATADWLRNEYGVPPRARAVPRAQKHVLIVRTCRCGRKIAGNVFFKHLKSCLLSPRKPSRAEDGNGAAADGYARHHDSAARPA